MMGQFSWKTGDTKRSIHSEGDCGCSFPVAMILPDNTRYLEKYYEGYGDFGDKDIFEVVAELNGKKDRGDGIEITADNHSTKGFEKAAKKGYKIPKLAEDLFANYDDLDYPERCPDQGWVCVSEEEEEEEPNDL